MKYSITHEQLQSIINYLASKPYSEVYQGIAILQTLDKLTEADAERPKPSLVKDDAA